jgi:aminoglycoside phosphotransferase (APT) family kinase protein
METSDKKIVSQIGSKFLNTKDFSIKHIGQGSNNKNLLVKSQDKEIVVKLSLPHKEYKAYQDYIKEKWCIEKSKEVAVPGPDVLAVGKSQGRAYMIETFVPGINGKKLKNKLNIYYKLGKYTKLIHSVKTSGFGENLTNPKRGTFNDSWRRYVDYNIKSLTGDDELIKLKAINLEQSKKVKKIFQNIKKQKYKFGLNHGDISVQNTLVEKSGQVNLLDWGSAEAHIIPYYDFIYVFRHTIYNGKTKDEEFKQFIKGYGMSKKDFKILKPELLKIMLLVSFDKLRWAIDRNPKEIKKFIRIIKKILKLNNI